MLQFLNGREKKFFQLKKNLETSTLQLSNFTNEETEAQKSAVTSRLSSIISPLSDMWLAIVMEGSWGTRWKPDGKQLSTKC